MIRCFDIGLVESDGWTEGEFWEDCNPFRSVKSIYSRLYSAETDSTGNPVYRLDGGDVMHIGSAPDQVKDITKKGDAWHLDSIESDYGAEISFYFGLQVGENSIDSKIDIHAPYIIGESASSVLFDLDADWHRFYGLKVKGFYSSLKFLKNIEGLTIDGFVSFSGMVFDSNGFIPTQTKLRNVHLYDQTSPTISLGDGVSIFSFHEFSAEGKGNIGINIGDNHDGIEIIAGKIVNKDHDYETTGQLVRGLVVGGGGLVVARYIELHGFSGGSFHFDSQVEARQLHSYRCGAGVYIGGAGSILHGCMMAWTRQVSGDSYGYYLNADCELVNCSSNMDETGGLGVIVVNGGAFVTVSGGDYRARLPLPFITALSDCTVVLDNVRVNGVMYNITLNLTAGQSWRGSLAPVTTDLLEANSNQILILPKDHLPILADAVSVQGSDRPFENVITLPSGAKIAPIRGGALKYIPDEAFLHLDPNESAIDYFRYSTEDNIYTHQIIVNGSSEVSAKLVNPGGFSGSGWQASGQSYSCTLNDFALSANCSMTSGKVYQISIKISEVSSGSIRPEIVGSNTSAATYSHSITGTEVWLIRAPSSPVNINIVPDNFTGTVENIYFRELLVSGSVPTPQLTGESIDSTILLDWRIDPAAQIKDTVNATKGASNQVMNASDESGFYDDSHAGNFYFKNVSCTGKRKGLSIYGGESLQVDGMDFVGGYTGSNERWQVPIVVDQNGGPYMQLMQLGYLTADLLLDSSYGNYNGQFGNSDIVVINGGSSQEAYDKRAYIYGMDGKHGSDSITDSKAYTEINFSTLTGAYRGFRLHDIATARISNCEFTQEYGTREAITTQYSHAVIELWNTQVDGVRAVTTEQMLSAKKGGDFYYEGVGQIHNAPSISILKTYPTIHDYSRINMTDMEFQISADGGSNWSALDVPNVGLPGVVGCFKRTFSYSSGTYAIRCRCLNGALIGAWSNEITITV